MSPADIAAIAPESTPTTARRATHRRYLFGPRTDFFCLGGSSLLVLPLVAMLPEESYHGPLSAIMLLVAMVINNPHFAHSYQLFYRSFANKAFGAEHPRMLRGRYVVAGLIVPALLTLFFAWCLWQQDVRLLGFGANLMGLLVGWHYVKQGYGMLMVDAALKRKFFSESDKKVFLANGYAVWMLTWLQINSTFREDALWGLQYYTLGVPGWLMWAVAVIVAVTSAATALTLVRRWKANGDYLPINGVIAYLVTLYGWMLFVRLSPLWVLVVPALHSLQYLLVVYRYELNYEKARPNAFSSPELGPMRRLFGQLYRAKMLGFALLGVTLGFLGFFGLPSILQSNVETDAVFGPTLFMFVFWIFINVHHYFLDSVMWRRENPDTKRFLFS